MADTADKTSAPKQKPTPEKTQKSPTHLHVKADAVQVDDIVILTSADGSIQVWGCVLEIGKHAEQGLVIMTIRPLPVDGTQKEITSQRRASTDTLAVIRGT